MPRERILPWIPGYDYKIEWRENYLLLRNTLFISSSFIHIKGKELGSFIFILLNEPFIAGLLHPDNK